MFSIRIGRETVGWSELPTHDAETGVAWGVFKPGSAYELVRPTFRKFTNALPETSSGTPNERELASYYAERDTLGMSLHRQDDTEIPISYIHLADFGDLEDIEIEVAIADAEAWRLFIG